MAKAAEGFPSQGFTSSGSSRLFLPATRSRHASGTPWLQAGRDLGRGQPSGQHAGQRTGRVHRLLAEALTVAGPRVRLGCTPTVGRGYRRA
jgi:hypothetical protein